MKEDIQNIENKFDKDLKNPAGVGKQDIFSIIGEIEKQKLGIGERFVAEDLRQKTDIDTDESIILSILEYVAQSPYSLSSRIEHDKNNPYHVVKKKNNDYKIIPIEKFLNNYIRYKISVKRKGRGEIVEVLKSVFSGNSLMDSVRILEKPLK